MIDRYLQIDYWICRVSGVRVVMFFCCFFLHVTSCCISRTVLFLIVNSELLSGHVAIFSCWPDKKKIRMCAQKQQKLAFNIRALFWDYKKTPTLSHKNLFSTITYGKRPTKRKASPTTAMVPKKPRQPQRKPRAPHGDVTGHASTVV